MEEGGGGGSMRDSDKRRGCGVGGWVRRQTQFGVAFESVNNSCI